MHVHMGREDTRLDTAVKHQEQLALLQLPQGCSSLTTYVDLAVAPAIDRMCGLAEWQ
jgi:hypothetical protein